MNSYMLVKKASIYHSQFILICIYANDSSIFELYVEDKIFIYNSIYTKHSYMLVKTSYLLIL